MKPFIRNFILLAIIFCLGQSVFGQLTSNAILNYVPVSPCASMPVRLTVTDLNGVLSPSYMVVDWDFGDGTTQLNSYGGWINHTYAAGNYMACAFIYDSSATNLDTACVYFTVNSCGPVDNFNGVVYRDLNNNGVKNSNEPGVPFATLQAAPNGYVFTTDYNGNYSIPMPAGSHTLSSSVPMYHTPNQPIGGNYAITSTGTGATTNNLNFGNVPIPSQQDMGVFFIYRPHVPGFNTTIRVYVNNLGTQAQSGNLEITLDPNVTWAGSLEGCYYSGGLVICPYSVGANSSDGAGFTVTSSTSLPIGSTVTYTGIVYPLLGDQNPINNYDTIINPVVASWDPNDKAVKAIGMGPNGEINAGDELTYTVRFQNEGNFPATFIYIRDTLDPNLDWSSFRVLASSHQMSHTQNNDQIQFYFDDIQLVPKSVDEEASQGFVVYKIKSKSTLLPGDEMRNTASIYFDYNPAVVTNTTLNSVWIPTALEDEMNPMEIVLFPNPMAERATLRFDAGGESWDLKVTDLQGRTVMERMHETTGHIEILRGELAAGTYLFQLVSDAGKMATGKMIVE